MPLDGVGFVGMVTQYALALLFTGGAVVFFCHFLWYGLASLDEDPKKEMMREDG